MRRTVSLLGLRRSARDLAHSTVFCCDFVLLGAIGANLVHAILIRDEQRAFFDPTWADPPTDIALRSRKNLIS
jgi:hypothetical protein